MQSAKSGRKPDATHETETVFLYNSMKSETRSWSVSAAWTPINKAPKFTSHPIIYYGYEPSIS